MSNLKSQEKNPDGSIKHILQRARQGAERKKRQQTGDRIE